MPVPGTTSPDPDYDAARALLPSPDDVELAVQVPLKQSLLSAQVSPVTQVSQMTPPQSVSVSDPFRVESGPFMLWLVVCWSYMASDFPMGAQ